MDIFYKNCPIWLKFSMQVSLIPVYYPEKFTWGRSIILPSSPTNLNLDLKIFQIKQPLSPCFSVSWSVCHTLHCSELPLLPLLTITCPCSPLSPTITAPAHRYRPCPPILSLTPILFRFFTFVVTWIYRSCFPSLSAMDTVSETLFRSCFLHVLDVSLIKLPDFFFKCQPSFRYFSWMLLSLNHFVG